MNKQSFIIIICMAALLTVISVIYFAGFISPVGDPEGLTIEIIHKGNVIEADRDLITGLQGETFNAVIRSSGQKPRETEYTGVPLSGLLLEMNINMENNKQVIITGSDGYVVVVTAEEINEPKNTYIAYAIDGEEIKPRKKGGVGPYQLIIRKDGFSQRWCKYVTQIEII